MEIIMQHFSLTESMTTTYMETGVLDENKEHYLRSKEDKAEKPYDVLRHTQLHMPKCQKEDLQYVMSLIQYFIDDDYAIIISLRINSWTTDRLVIVMFFLAATKQL